MAVKIINVVAALIVHDGRIFATQRGYGDWKGWWEFPGGKVEPGWTANICAVCSGCLLTRQSCPRLKHFFDDEFFTFRP